MNFTWVPFYRELIGKILEYEDRQSELTQILRDMYDDGRGVEVPTEPMANGISKDSNVIDPFTFLACIGTKEANYGSLKSPIAETPFEFLKQYWDLRSEFPIDFNGFANVNFRVTRFFAYEKERKKDDIPRLWRLVRQAYVGLDAIESENFDACLKISLRFLRRLDIKRVTCALCWINPDEFLPSYTFDYLQDLGVDTPLIENFDSYRNFLNQVKQIVKIPFIEIVSEIDGDAESEERKPMSRIPLNQILYGPPGTGKTYNSIQRAVEIIDGKKLSHEDAKKRFKELRASDQIGFVTFHQSFSYEEFVEGLRPILDDGEARYEIRDGILKKIAKVAQKAFSGEIETSFEEAWDLICEYIKQNPKKIINGLSAKSRYKLSIDKDIIWGINTLSTSDRNNFTCRKENARTIWENLRNKPEISSYDIQKIGLKLGGEAGFTAVITNLMKNLVQPNQELKKNVLIIDEINRGNISKILGELITLLEEDKRIGAENELWLTLPTSGEEFCLPPNLYILGTMNTSDKSLAQLDVALRRRFSFIEMPPRLELCDNLAGQVEVLRELNNRLEWALDREHRLGHAYFMNVDSEEAFNEKFQTQIVPLLIEYFPHEFRTLRDVLGEKTDGFLIKMKQPDGFSGGREKYRWWFESDVSDFSAFATLKANYGL